MATQQDAKSFDAVQRRAGHFAVLKVGIVVTVERCVWRFLRKASGKSARTTRKVRARY